MRVCVWAYMCLCMVVLSLACVQRECVCILCLCVCLSVPGFWWIQINSTSDRLRCTPRALFCAMIFFPIPQSPHSVCLFVIYVHKDLLMRWHRMHVFFGTKEGTWECSACCLVISRWFNCEKIAATEFKMNTKLIILFKEITSCKWKWSKMFDFCCCNKDLLSPKSIKARPSLLIDGWCANHMQLHSKIWALYNLVSLRHFPWKREIGEKKR